MDRFHHARREIADAIGRRFRPYFMGVGAMALLIVSRRFVLDSYFDVHLPLRLFLLPVIAAAWSGGFWPGLFTTLLGAVAAPALLGAGGLAAIDRQMTLTFVVVGLVVCGFMESLHATRRRLEQRQRQLEREMAERQKAETGERTHRERLAQEIENRALAETSLREQEERVRMAVESANIGTWDLNVLTGKRQWSVRSKAMFGLAADTDVSQLAFVDLLHPDDQQPVRQAIEQALNPTGDGRYEVEYRARWRDGTIRWIIAKGQAFFQGEGTQRQAVAFHRHGLRLQRTKGDGASPAKRRSSQGRVPGHAGA